MSEKQISHMENQSDRPEASPEQKKAFSQTYAKLVQFLQAHSEPTMATEANDGQPVARYMDVKEASIFKVDFQANSLGGEIHLGDKPGWAYINTEQTPTTIRELALIAFCEPGNQQEQEIFVFGRDANIEHFHYGDFAGSETDEEDEVYTDPYESRHIGWLNAEEIETLGRQIEELEPGWVDIAQ